MYRSVLWRVPTVEKFPRRQKLLLGDRLQATAPRRARAAGRGDVHARPAPAPDGGETWASRSCGSCAGSRTTSGTWTNAATSKRRAPSTRRTRCSAAGGRRMRRPRADGLFDRIATFGALCAAASRAAPVSGERRHRCALHEPDVPCVALLAAGDDTDTVRRPRRPRRRSTGRQLTSLRRSPAMKNSRRRAGRARARRGLRADSDRVRRRWWPVTRSAARFPDPERSPALPAVAGRPAEPRRTRGRSVR